MGFIANTDELKMPKKIEPCCRCSGESTVIKGKPLVRTNMGKTVKIKEDGPDLYVRLCTHCGFRVPIDVGCRSGAEASLLWNGEMCKRRADPTGKVSFMAKRAESQATDPPASDQS